MLGAHDLHLLGSEPPEVIGLLQCQILVVQEQMHHILVQLRFFDLGTFGECLQKQIFQLRAITDLFPDGIQRDVVLTVDLTAECLLHISPGQSAELGGECLQCGVLNHIHILTGVGEVGVVAGIIIALGFHQNAVILTFTEYQQTVMDTTGVAGQSGSHLVNEGVVIGEVVAECGKLMGRQFYHFLNHAWVLKHFGVIAPKVSMDDAHGYLLYMAGTMPGCSSSS